MVTRDLRQQTLHVLLNRLYSKEFKQRLGAVFLFKKVIMGYTKESLSINVVSLRKFVHKRYSDNEFRRII